MRLASPCRCLIALGLLLVTTFAWPQDEAPIATAADAEGAQGKLVLAIPDGSDIAYGSWDETVTGGQIPSWTYLFSLRNRAVPYQSWLDSSIMANAIYYFSGGNLRAKVELPYTPSPDEGWIEESTAFHLGVNGRHLTSHHDKGLSPDEGGRRYPLLSENKVLDYTGTVVADGTGVAEVSLNGKFGIVAGGVRELATGRIILSGTPRFSRYDDSYVANSGGTSGLEYHATDGHIVWFASLGGNVHSIVISPGGKYVFAVAQNDSTTCFAGIIDASGKVLWKMKVIMGPFPAAFSPDGTRLAMLTRDANWILETATGKIISKIPMPVIFHNENQYSSTSKIYLSPIGDTVTVIARTKKTDRSSQALMTGAALAISDEDVIYEYDAHDGRILSRFSATTFRVIGWNYGAEPLATVSPDGKWAYYLTAKGLFATHL